MHLLKVCQNRKDLLKKKSNGIRLIKNKYTNDIMGEKYLNYLNKKFMIKISNLFYPNLNVI